MKKKVNKILNVVMGSFTGMFLGSGLYRYWHFQKYPNLYITNSAPWYTGILINGLFTLSLLTICIIIKFILREKIEMTKKLALILGTIFLILTFIGGGYVLMNHGQVNAGYAVIPSIWSTICFGYYRNKSKTNI